MNQRIAAIAGLTLLEARRNRLAWLVVVVLGLVFALAQFVGEVAVIETAAMQNALLGALLRGVAVFVVAMFVVTSTVREFNDKVFDLMLSMPIPRWAYYAGKLLGFSLFAVLVAVILSLPLYLQADVGQVTLWMVSLAAELLIVASLSLLCLFTFSQVTVALSAVLGFYVLARSIAAIQLITQSGLVELHSLSHQVMTVTVDAIAFILPDLYRFTSSQWLVYQTGDWRVLVPIVLQTIAYLVLLGGASLFDLYRKNL